MSQDVNVLTFPKEFDNSSQSSMESILSKSWISTPLPSFSGIHVENPLASSTSALDGADEVVSGLFTLFLLLPLELQRNIWHYAVISPRIVEIHEEDINVPTAKGQRNQEMPPPLCSIVHHFRSKTSHPPLLQACLESRKVALKFKYGNKDLSSVGCMKPVYFEFEVDTAFLSQETLKIWESSWLRKRDKYNNTPRFPRWSAAAHGMRQNLRSIAFGAEILTEREFTEEGSRMVPSVYSCRNIVGNLFQFGALEEIVVVLNDDGKLSCDEKLSTIRLFQPVPLMEVTVLLRDVCDILEQEYTLHINELLLRGQQRQRQSGYHGRGWPRRPISSRNRPAIKCMITKLRM